jgi:serine/threonine protein kinase
MAQAESYLQYEILRRENGKLWELGRGAMGITYKAHDTILRCTVALKVINSDYLGSDLAQQRFLREARAAAALRHENVASVFYLGTDHHTSFYTMEWVDGETVAEYVKRKGPLEPLEVLNIALQASSALAAADKRQLVHRDLKPTNVMLVYNAEGEHVVKVIDFGLAKRAKGESGDSCALTKAGGFVGTPQFASPEQMEEGDVDIRSDIYSLGVTLYFMLTGKPPFSGSAGQIMGQHLYKSVPMAPLAQLPKCVVALIERMTSKERIKRPQTPRDLQRDILACLELIRLPSEKTDDKVAGKPNSLPQDHPNIALVPGSYFATIYKLVRELNELPQGRQFIAEDVRHRRPVSLLVLSSPLLVDKTQGALLEQAVQQLRNAPHPMLRAVFAIESAGGYSFLVQEHVRGPTLLEMLRKRGVLSAPEVVQLLVHLAPLADHAQRNSLKQVALTLRGIHLTDPEVSANATQSALVRRPVNPLERLEAKVNGIDLSQVGVNVSEWAGSVTWVKDVTDEGAPSSYVRRLSLLGYELLGGQRGRVEATGRVTPLAALNEEGNAALRRGIAEEFSSAVEMARGLAACVKAKGIVVSQPKTVSFSRMASSPANTIVVRMDSKKSTPVHVHAKPNLIQTDGRWILAVALIASCGLGVGVSTFGVLGNGTSAVSTPKHRPTVAEQSTVKEQPTVSVAETRNADSPSLSLAVEPRPSPERSVITPEPLPTPQAVVQASQVPRAYQEEATTQMNNPEAESSHVTSDSSFRAATSMADKPTEVIPLDAKLVGDWHGKTNGSKGEDDRHWEQQSDGRYMMTGVITESGTLIARDGKLEKTVDGAREVVEVVYAINGNTVVTTEADGKTVIWNRTNATPFLSRWSHSSESKKRQTRHAVELSGHSRGFWQTLRKYFQ